MESANSTITPPPSPQPSAPVATPAPSSPKLTLQAILDCKTGSSDTMAKVLKMNPSLEQLQKFEDYQTQCYKILTLAAEKINEEPVTGANKALLSALEKTQKRLILENQMVRKLEASYKSNNGVELTQNVIGYVYAGKLVVEQEAKAWGEYKTALEVESKNATVGSRPIMDYFSWILLIFLIFIVGSRVWRRIIKPKINPKSQE